MKGIYAGSFSPPTSGRLDIIRRAAQVLDEVVVAILVNPEKKYIFSMPEKTAHVLHICQESTC